jgi:Lrp/AsnC family transcriptional regulator for asnA, asnC and gidA
VNEKDVKIIEIMMENARTPKTNIARELNITEAAVRKRILNLEKEKIVLGYKAVVNYKTVGLSASLTGLDVEPEKLWYVVDELKKVDEVKSMWLTTGDHTLMAEIVAKGVEAISAIHEKIGKIKGIKRVCPSIIVDVLK